MLFRRCFCSQDRRRIKTCLNEDDDVDGRWSHRSRLGFSSFVSFTLSSRGLFSANEAARRQRWSETEMRPTVCRWVCRSAGNRLAGRRVGTTTGHTGACDSVSLSSTQSSVSYRCRQCDRACNDDLRYLIECLSSTMTTTTTNRDNRRRHMFVFPLRCLSLRLSNHLTVLHSLHSSIQSHYSLSLFWKHSSMIRQLHWQCCMGPESIHLSYLDWIINQDDSAN